MTGQPSERQQDKSGEWYLDLLSINGDSGNPPVTTGPANAAEVVTEMWQKTAELEPADIVQDPLRDWKPTELSRSATTSRNVRWSVIVTAIIVGLGAAFALWWLPQVSERRADDHADLMRETITGVHEDLAATQQALATATEPSSTTPDLGTVAANLAGIADSAARLLNVSEREVPSPLPLGDSDSFAYLESFRHGLEPLAAEATAIRSGIADITDYRFAVAKVLVVDELPLTADSATIAETGAGLVRSLSESVGALAAMPIAGPFAEHRSAVDAAVGGFAEWQQSYLEALREGDAARAGRLIDELNTTRQRILLHLVPPLAELRIELDGRILELADRLSMVLESLP